MTDEDILDMIRIPVKREEGFKHLVVKYQQRLYQVIRRRVSTHEDADDIMQNTFLKVFSNIASFEGRSELFTWIYRIGCNEVINQLKKNSRVRIEELNDVHGGYAEGFVDAHDVASALISAVSRLPGRQQMVFRLRYFDELSYKEMAGLLQLSEGALKASYHHAVRKIEEEFKAKQIL